VGSDRVRARAALEAALKRQASVRVKLRRELPKAPGSLAIAFEVTRAERGGVLHLAVVQPRAISAVKRGENAGRTLRHDNVVRAFTSTRLDENGKGNVDLKLPADLVNHNSAVIGYVQEADTGVVLGATALAFGPDASH
jgi:hypothetical protein